MSGHEGASANAKADQLRRSAAELRARAERVEAMATNWQAGADGERRTADALRPLEGEHCRVLHDRLLEPGRSKVNLDHLVCSVAGIYLIDSKNWSGSASVVGHSLRTTSSSGSSWGHDNVLDKLRETAARIAAEARTEVFPVLCLSSTDSAAFGEPAFIRGVFIVPVSKLATWLLNRPRTVDPITCKNRAIQLAASFPSSTEPAFLSVPVSRAQRPVGPARASTARKPTVRKPARGRRDSPVAKFVAALVLMALLLTPFGQRLFAGTVSAFGNFMADRVAKAQPHPVAASWVHPCSQLPDVVVARTVGHPVYRVQAGANDTCTWALAPKSTVAVVRVITGSVAQSAYVQKHKAGYAQVGRNATLIVPQFTALAGSSVPPSRITQPIVVSISWPTGAVPQNLQRMAADLALETAKHLPTGPGATTIAVHR